MIARGLRGSMLVLAAAVTSGCMAVAESPAVQAPPRVSPAAPVLVVRDDLQSVFDEAGVQGAFVLFDVGANRLVVVDQARAQRPAVPVSTFKVAHSLIALETGAVRDVDEVIPYGGAPQPFPAWEHDMSIRQAVAASNATIFQEIARRIGPPRELDWLARLGYGNRQVGPALDRFWLDGPLEISPIEQTRFLSRLAQRLLPVSASTQDAVASVLELERTGDHVLFGKTGWQFDAVPPQLGWWVGWVERPDGIFTFALIMDMAGAGDATMRMSLGRELLRRLQVLP